MERKYLLMLLSLLFGFKSISQNNSEYKYFRGNPEDSLAILQLLSDARIIYSNQEFDSVISLSEKILDESIKIQFLRGSGESYFLKARALNRLNMRQKALEIYEKALEVFELLNDHSRMASAYNNKGIILKAIGKFREAIESGELALYHANLTNPGKLKFHILNNLGNSYQELALLKKASSSYFASLKVLQNEEDSIYKERMQAEVYINLGIIYYEQRLYNEALEIYGKARIILEKQQMRPQLATVYNNLGVLLIETKDFNRANTYLVQAQNIYIELNNKVEEAVCLSNVGRILYAQNKYDLAINKYLVAIRDLEKLQATSYLPSSYLQLGKGYLGSGYPKKAKLALLKGLQIALKSGQKKWELKLYEGLIALYKQQEELELSLMYYDLYSALSQDLNDQQIGRFIGKQELNEYINRRDQALKSLQTETALLEFQIGQRNILLALSILVLVLATVLFTTAYRQNRLKTMNRNFVLEQKLLRSQLNPHFIFNALGAIQHYMISKSPQKAASYLAKFSKLMRSILESSRSAKISLGKELELIKYYLDLQSLRFTDAFNYNIDLDPELDMDNVQVPSLIIQPLLENAIEHGLMPKLGGSIEIEIKQEGDNLLVNIDDDGIGIEAPNQNKLHKKNKGLGNTMIRERLSLVNRRDRRKILFNIERRSHLMENLPGTRATLMIPI